MNEHSNTERTVERVKAAVIAMQPMPTMIREVLDQIRDPNIEGAQLIETLRNDPGLTVNILRVVNSPVYASGSERVESLLQAFVRLGARTVCRIVIAHGLAGQLAGRLPGYELEPRALLQHAVGVALNAEALASLLQKGSPDVLFTAGLLHDIGKVVLDPFITEVRPELDQMLAQNSTCTFDQMERQLLGVTHAEAGAWLLRHWNVPGLPAMAAEMHHDPESAPATMREDVLVIHLADTLVYAQGVGDGIDGLRYRAHGNAAAALGLRTRDLESIAGQTWEKVREWSALLS